MPSLQSKASWPKVPGVVEMYKFSKQVHWAWRELLLLSYCGSWTHVFYPLNIQHHIIFSDLGHILFLWGWFPILLKSSLQGCSSKVLSFCQLQLLSSMICEMTHEMTQGLCAHCWISFALNGSLSPIRYDGGYYADKSSTLTALGKWCWRRLLVEQ